MSVRATGRLIGRWLACWVCVVGFSATTTWADTATKSDDERAAIRHGADLEIERRWIDAIEHYEKVLETWPDNEVLKYALRRSKVHFSVERRYSDASFLKQLWAKDRAESLLYLSDVLGKIREQYVDPLSVTSFVAHGTESLYQALHNERFMKHNAPSADPATVDRVRDRLRADFWNRPVQGIDGARATVTEVCQICAHELNIPAGGVVMEYLFGGCNALDDYSSYLTPGKLADLYSNIDGEFVGIGIEMKADLGKGMLLVNVLPESPADEGGALAGDFITEIDHVDCRNMTTEEAATLLQGTPGSRVRLILMNPETKEPRSTLLTRRAVKVKSIPTVEIIDTVNGVGYIKLAGFQKTTAEELDAALLKLHREGMRALILDVRGNPGGLLNAAVEVLDRFLEEGVLVSTRGRMGDQNWSYSAQRPGTWNMPLTLLVDSDSASASEVVAGAIKDHRRGTVVGRKTYGKWSVQTILPGLGETGMRLTTAKFYSPAGKTFGKIGLEPDVTVAASPTRRQTTAYRGQRDYSDDKDIQTGLGVLREQLAHR
jgi:carboxyl-terminal processing protease